MTDEDEALTKRYFHWRAAGKSFADRLRRSRVGSDFSELEHREALRAMGDTNEKKLIATIDELAMAYAIHGGPGIEAAARDIVRDFDWGNEPARSAVFTAKVTAIGKMEIEFDGIPNQTSATWEPGRASRGGLRPGAGGFPRGDELLVRTRWASVPALLRYA